MYEKKDACTECGGVCCKKYPGAAMPEDFGMPDTTKLVEALRSGKWAIDRWEADTPLYYVRPAVTSAIGQLFDYSWGGPCVFLSGTGCKLPPDDRPSGCRLLEPDVLGCIEHGAGKLEAGEAWQKYDLEKITDGMTSTQPPPKPDPADAYYPPRRKPGSGCAPCGGWGYNQDSGRRCQFCEGTAVTR